jgi:diaminohydroxyphosphoribosylaminopyrimidine deaminase/5-amino-6-(5-phosphoribosylamino)uracil reductase
MRRAVLIASRHHPHPNPKVGAVLIAADGSVIAEAAHEGPGTTHAERAVLEAIGAAPPDSALVVTLEPCAHTDRTPPCVDIVIEAGVRHVVVGAIDPDPRVAGEGIRRLRAAGVLVETGLLADDIEEADPGYFHHRRTGFPLITLKQATTLDGQIAAADGTSQWITGETARKDAHRLRAAHDAVMVGAGTLRADDPRLDVRLENYDGPQPVPVIVAGSRPLPANLRIWDREPLVLSSEEAVIEGTEVIRAGTGGVVDLRRGLELLAERGILTVLVEGGAGVAGGLWAQDLVDRGVLYLGSKMAGGTGRGTFDRVFTTLGEAVDVEITSVVHLAGDLRIDWRRVAAS